MLFNKQKKAETRHFYVDGDTIVFKGEYAKKEIQAISDMIRKHFNEKERRDMIFKKQNRNPNTTFHTDAFASHGNIDHVTTFDIPTEEKYKKSIPDKPYHFYGMIVDKKGDKYTFTPCEAFTRLNCFDVNCLDVIAGEQPVITSYDLWVLLKRDENLDEYTCEFNVAGEDVQDAIKRALYYFSVDEAAAMDEALQMGDQFTGNFEYFRRVYNKEGLLTSKHDKRPNP